MSSNPPDQYRMLLNTIEQAKYATFDIKTEATPPANKPTWVTVVTVTSVAPVLSRSIYVGTYYQGFGSTKRSAADAASEQMLRLFATYGVQPTIGR